MAYKNKTYIVFDGDNDMRYYRLMTAWSAHDKFEMKFVNAHELNSARDTSEEESIKRQLRERFANSKLVVVLIGDKTRYLTKFVKWEIETAIRLDLPIIAVNLNGSRNKDGLCPPALNGQLAVFVPFSDKIVSYAMDHWPESHASLKMQRKSEDYIYKPTVYQSLGMTT